MKLSKSLVNRLMQVIGTRLASEYLSKRAITYVGSGEYSRGGGYARALQLKFTYHWGG